MLLEPHYTYTDHQVSAGWIEVIAGGMFSGKTEELMRRLRRAQIAGQSTLIFKPSIDTRYDPEAVVSHDKRAIASTPVTVAQQILLLAQEIQVVGVDEAQFFDAEIVQVCNALADAGKRVIVAGLDMDHSGRPFGPMPQLMAVAEFVTKLHAICTRTGNMAQYSFRKNGHEGTLMLGESGAYEPLSRSAYRAALQEQEAQQQKLAASKL